MPPAADTALRCRPAAAMFAVMATLALAACGERPLPHDVATPQRIARGKQLLAQYQCGSCHAIPGIEASVGSTGPTLAAFGKRSYIAGQIPNGPDALARWIADPRAMVPDTTMPAMGATPDEASAMAAYLLQLK